MIAAPRVDGRHGQRGAALLTAMIIVALIATLAGSMVWQQWRAIQVEAAERARTQSAWILAGALDWARLLLREDAKNDQKNGLVDHLGEPWAVPLAEARLSTFLAVDKDNNTEDAPDAFLSGAITDATARYNLTNLMGTTPAEPIDQIELGTLLHLCETVGVSADVATNIAGALRAATPLAPALAPPAQGASGGAAAPPGPPLAQGTGGATASPADSPLLPRSASQLAWLRIDPEALRALAPYIVILPSRASVNVNTAPREVLVAATGQDPATAESIIQSRQRAPLKSLDALKALAPGISEKNLAHLAVHSNFFEVRGRLRLGDVVLEQRSLVYRRPDLEMVVLQRERVSLRDQPGS